MFDIAQRQRLDPQCAAIHDVLRRGSYRSSDIGNEVSGELNRTSKGRQQRLMQDLVGGVVQSYCVLPSISNFCNRYKVGRVGNNRGKRPPKAVLR